MDKDKLGQYAEQNKENPPSRLEGIEQFYSCGLYGVAHSKAVKYIKELEREREDEQQER